MVCPTKTTKMNQRAGRNAGALALALAAVLLCAPEAAVVSPAWTVTAPPSLVLPAPTVMLMLPDLSVSIASKISAAFCQRCVVSRCTGGSGLSLIADDAYAADCGGPLAPRGDAPQHSSRVPEHGVVLLGKARFRWCVGLEIGPQPTN